MSKPKRVIIQAGGVGSRVAHLADVPKPLLPVAGIPVVKRILDYLVAQGIEEVIFTVHYRADEIIAGIESLRKSSIKISFFREKEPLGVLGAVKRLVKSGEEVFVMNADVLCDISLEAFYKAHIDSKAHCSVVSSKYVLELPFGVTNLNGRHLLGIEEKPKEEFWVNSGVYLVNGDLFDEHIFDKDFSILDILKTNALVGYHKHEGLWIDVGTVENYQLAQKLFEKDA